MQFIEFENKVKEASRRLKSICPNGSPSEDEVKQTLESVGLRVTSDKDDQVFKAVSVLAYRSPMRGGTVVDRMLVNAWKWRERQDASSETLVSV